MLFEARHNPSCFELFITTFRNTSQTLKCFLQCVSKLTFLTWWKKKFQHICAKKVSTRGVLQVETELRGSGITNLFQISQVISWLGDFFFFFYIPELESPFHGEVIGFFPRKCFINIDEQFSQPFI